MMACPETFTLHTRVRAANPDADGNDVWIPTDVPVSGAFAPAGGTELIQGRDVLISNDSVYLLPGSPVPAATDQMTVRGTRREVDGTPSAYRNPFTGTEPGAVVRLMAVTG